MKEGKGSRGGERWAGVSHYGFYHVVQEGERGQQVGLLPQTCGWTCGHERMPPNQGLRLHDNPALLDACASRHMYPVFILDPFFLKSGSYK